MRKETKKKILLFAAAIVLPLAVGGFSALLTAGNMNVYDELATPPGSPPSAAFPIVWTVLYILMGVSSGVVWFRQRIDKNSADAGVCFYILSLAFNFVWSILFFNMRLFTFSFIWLCALLLLLVLTVVQYLKVSKTAAYLQIPYILWVAYAGYLNLGISILNK